LFGCWIVVNPTGYIDFTVMASSSNVPHVPLVSKDSIFGPYAPLRPPSLNSLPREDVDERELLLSEVPAYLSNSLWSNPKAYNVGGMYAHSVEIAPTAPQTSKDGGRVVWVENARTMQLVPLLLHRGSLGEEESDEINDDLNDFNNAVPLAIPLPSSLASGKGGDASADDDEADLQEQNLAQIAESGASDSYLLNTEVRNMVSLMKVFYLLCQGLFAGFCFSTIYYSMDTTNVQSASSDSNSQFYQFLANYYSTAEEHRRLCYLFSVIATVGAFDSFLQCLSIRKQQLAHRAHLQAHINMHDASSAAVTSADSHIGNSGGGGAGGANYYAAFQRQPVPTSVFLNEFMYSVMGALVQLAALIVTLIMAIMDVRIATR
jgi:hypothetical protein